MVKDLVPYLRKYRRAALISPALIIIEALIEVRIPFLMAKIVDVGIPSRNLAYVLQTGGLMLLMAIVSLLCGTIASRFSSIASMGFGSELRKGIFNKIQGFSFSNTDHFSTSSLVMRLTTDVSNVQTAFMMILRIFVRAPVMLICATTMAFQINASLVTVFLVVIPFLASVLGVIIVLAYPRFKAMFKKYDAMNASVQENLVGIRVVKAFVRSSYEKSKFKTSNDKLMESAVKAEKIVQINNPAMQLSIYGCIIAILWFGGQMVIGGSMKTGEMISFISYVTQIMMQLMLLSMVFVMIVISRESASRISEVLTEKPDLSDDDAPADGKVPDGRVEFDDVSFAYDTKAREKILENINFSVRPGETIGIIGGTGSAKSTLVQLIPRLYDVSDGQVRVGGRDVRSYKLAELRKAVGMVLQKNVLFSGTIRDNLKWGDANATDEEIEAACKAAQAHAFIESFPDGYDTVLGQGGVNVSGGQKQRLCIARALLSKPKILILDDSTSAVDTATDSKIREALKDYGRGITVMIIAQRISSVCDADRILVMDDGRINGIGTHDELLMSNAIYREVFESQQKGA
jgi:ATP-binding cassette, subfamily B, multidrug efflux pump